ncbi:MAG: copper homeostasis protein CutC [Alistipes sp.]|nr:copper homeostasis protein CutC [Alistipes sp.]
MTSELCAYSIAACRMAAAAGVNRVELCAAPSEGGTTPSAATIEMAREVEHLSLSVMIRPRGGDFLYSDEEFEQMRRDTLFARRAGADSVVIGLLTADGMIDTVRTAALVEIAAPMKVTFHRAVDLTRDYLHAVEQIIACGCHRILTSGAESTAAKGIDNLRRAVETADGRIEIMAGCGVNPSNVGLIAATGIDALHFSARRAVESAMRYRREGVNMGAAVDEYALAEADPATIREIINKIKEL